MDISRKYRQVLIDLFSSPNGLFAYTLYGRYGVTPSEAMAFIAEFKGEGIIDIDKDNRLFLTGEGRKRILSIVNIKNNSSEEKIVYLERFRSTMSVEINVPYLPDNIFYFKYISREVDKTSQ